MWRVIDTDGLAAVRTRVAALAPALADHRDAARPVLLSHGHPDVTWRLPTVERWLIDSAADLARRIEAARLSKWLRQTPGTGLTPPPVAAWDAVSSSLGRVIAASYLAGLPPAEQRLIARWRTVAVASLPGAPLAARVEANRRLIETEIDSLQRHITEARDSLAGFPLRSGARRWREAHLEELRAQQAILKRLAARNPIWFEPGDDGRFMEWIGPEDAAHIVILVPGTGHSLWTADDLSVTAGRIHETSSTFTREGVATVVAMGYDAPNNVPAAAFSSYADHGGPELARILDSIGISGDRHVTIVGHSYGSLVATRAVSEVGALEVDELVLIGSPGVGVGSAAEIPLDSGRVWVGLTDNDSITLTSADRWQTWLEKVDLSPFDWTTWDVRRHGTYEDLWFGTNPAHPSFGAQRLEMFEADGHNGYFGGTDQNESALENLARVFVGLDPVLDE